MFSTPLQASELFEALAPALSSLSSLRCITVALFVMATCIRAIICCFLRGIRRNFYKETSIFDDINGNIHGGFNTILHDRFTRKLIWRKTHSATIEANNTHTHTHLPLRGTEFPPFVAHLPSVIVPLVPQGSALPGTLLMGNTTPRLSLWPVLLLDHPQPSPVALTARPSSSHA